MQTSGTRTYVKESNEPTQTWFNKHQKSRHSRRAPRSTKTPTTTIVTYSEYHITTAAFGSRRTASDPDTQKKTLKAVESTCSNNPRPLERNIPSSPAVTPGSSPRVPAPSDTDRRANRWSCTKPAPPVLHTPLPRHQTPLPRRPLPTERRPPTSHAEGSRWGWLMVLT